MTKIEREVRRESCRANWRGRPIIVSLMPGDILGFRAKGTRQTYKLPIYYCYIHAAEKHASAQRRWVKKKLQTKKSRRVYGREKTKGGSRQNNTR